MKIIKNCMSRKITTITTKFGINHIKNAIEIIYIQILIVFNNIDNFESLMFESNFIATSEYIPSDSLYSGPILVCVVVSKKNLIDN
jgi:hypothetical protein